MERKRQKLTPGKVIAELEQVNEEQAHDKINVETEKCEWKSKIDKYKEQCTKLQSENEKLQSENKRFQKFLQDLESAKINVEEKSPINLCNTDLNSQITKIMNNRYPQTPIMNPPPGIPRGYPCGPTPMRTSNPLYSSGVGFAPNMSASPFPTIAFTSVNRSNSSYPSSSSVYLLAPNNSYPVSSSPYPASSNSHYPTSSNSSYPAPTSAYPCSSNRHYPSTNSSYSGPTSMNQPPGASPYPLMGSRGYGSRFGPSVNETNDYALDINAMPNEIILKVFSYLTQNQLGQIARFKTSISNSCIVRDYRSESLIPVSLAGQSSISNDVEIGAPNNGDARIIDRHSSTGKSTLPCMNAGSILVPRSLQMKIRLLSG